MSTGTLPRQADIRKLAHTGAVLQGAAAVLDFPRLVRALADESGSIVYSLSFGLDDQGVVTLCGVLAVTVRLPCQRCLEAMDLDIDSHFELGLVANEAAASQLPKPLEPLVVEDGLLDTVVVLEDEVLLSLPFVCFHEEKDCSATPGYTTQDDRFERSQVDRPKPFESLASLKKK